MSVLLLGLAAALIGHFGLWAVSPVFPQAYYQPFIDTASTLIPHGAAIMVADLMRRHDLKNGSWFGPAHRARQANTANYIRVALISGIAGYLGLILWGFAFQSLTTKGLLIDVPNALLAMATGGFYVYHLDNVEMNRRPSRLWEVGPQTVVTGICGLIAASESFELILGSANMATDKIILTTVISAAVGFTLAWYIPEAAAAAKYDPLAEAKEERIRTLEAAARGRFGSSAAAADWLETRHPALGDKSPKAAAADVEGFGHAISLLQGPQAIVA